MSHWGGGLNYVQFWWHFYNIQHIDCYCIKGLNAAFLCHCRFEVIYDDRKLCFFEQFPPPFGKCQIQQFARCADSVVPILAKWQKHKTEWQKHTTWCQKLITLWKMHIMTKAPPKTTIITKAYYIMAKAPHIMTKAHHILEKSTWQKHPI